MCISSLFVFTASRPTIRKPEKSKQLSNEFKMAADGRMVITELEDDKPHTANKDDGMHMLAES